jgi:3-oxoadipate enol-lactonase
MAPLLESTLARWFTQASRDRGGPVMEHVKKMILSTPPAGFAGCCAAIAPLDLTDRIGAIRLPTLVLVGEDDPGTPVAASRVIHEHIKGSDLVILKSAAHLSNLEQPEAFTRALTAFLARVA